MIFQLFVFQTEPGRRQVTHGIPPGAAMHHLRHLWLRGWATSTTLQTGNVCNSIYIIW